MESQIKIKSSGTEQIELSYIDFSVDQIYPEKVIQNVATAINVQQVIEEDQNIPFVKFNQFEQALSVEKLFLYGPSGSGKSRFILEILKRNISTITNIYVITPCNTAEKVQMVDLLELVKKFKIGDAVIWDNFPDDLIKRDFHTVLRVLEIISSRNAFVFIALRQRYLEAYGNITTSIPDLYSFSMVYDKKKIKEIVRIYGSRLDRFKPLYELHVSKDLDTISTILWKREPIPITVFNYYKALEIALDRNVEGMSQIHKGTDKKAGKISIDAVQEAKNLTARSNFYEHQFLLMRNDSSDSKILISYVP